MGPSIAELIRTALISATKQKNLFFLLHFTKIIAANVNSTKYKPFLRNSITPNADKESIHFWRVDNSVVIISIKAHINTPTNAAKIMSLLIVIANILKDG